MTTRARSLVLSSVATSIAISLGVFVVHRQWIAPLERRQGEMRRDVAAAEQGVEAARTELQGIKDREQEVVRARKSLSALHETAPLGGAVAWFPPRLKAQLSECGVTQADIRLNAAVAVAGLPGYEWTYWHVLLPPQSALRKVSDLLSVVGQIEGQDRFVKVVDFALHSGTGESASPTGSMNVKAFVRK